MVSLKGTIKQIVAELLSLPQLSGEKIFLCTIKKYEANRGLTANAYYWALVNEYAIWSGRSETYIHNDILEHYGQDLVIDEKTNERLTVPVRCDLDYHEFTGLHLRGTSKYFRGDNGLEYRVCVIRKGSHELTSSEFARIIDGLIYEIQGSNAPIQTMSRTELMRLKGYGIQV